jgi:H+/gluconate symporter-like permease
MNEAWPALCTLIALIALLILIIRYELSAFVALLVVSLGLGLAAGMPPTTAVATVSKGIGDIMREVTVILALGAMLGRILEASGGAEVIAQRLIRTFGQRNASFALLLAAYLVGLPILFNVGFLVLVPIVYRLQKQTGQSLLYFLLPVAFSLGMTHSLVPPHPGIVGAVQILSGAKEAPGKAAAKKADAPRQQAAPEGQPRRTEPERVMVETIIFGALMSLPLALAGWFIPGRWWASRQHVSNPEQLAGKLEERTGPEASFLASLAVVTLPLILSVLGFGAQLLEELKLLPAWMSAPLVLPEEVPPSLKILTHTPLAWIKFLGTPTMALLVPTGLAFWLLGARRGFDRGQLAKIAEKALGDVGSILFLFGAAGGFKEVIVDTGAGDWIAQAVAALPISRVATAYFVAAMVRVALGSATASILTASSLLVGLVRDMPGQETLMVLAVANGVTFMTQPADSGFWMIKEYGNLNVREVMIRFNACRIFMSLSGLAILLAYEALL